MTLQEAVDCSKQEMQVDVVGLWELYIDATRVEPSQSPIDGTLEIAARLLDDPLTVVGRASLEHQAYLIWQGSKATLLQRIKDSLIALGTEPMPGDVCYFICPTISEVPCEPE